MKSKKTIAQGLVTREKKVSRYLKLRKKLRVLSFEEISKRLKLIDITQSRENLSNKFQTGRISASLLFSILEVMDEESVDLKDLNKSI